MAKKLANRLLIVLGLMACISLFFVFLSLRAYSGILHDPTEIVTWDGMGSWSTEATSRRIARAAFAAVVTPICPGVCMAVVTTLWTVATHKD